MNYYSESGEYVEVPLDPDLTPQANAQFYFRKYAKAKSTYINTSRQLEQTQSELDYLESVLQMLDNCTSLQEIDEVRQELVDRATWHRSAGGTTKGPGCDKAFPLQILGRIRHTRRKEQHPE